MRLLSRRERALLLALLGAALVIRLVCVLWLHPPGSSVWSDMGVYDLRARHLLSGELGPWDAFTPPGYPAFLALVYGLYGSLAVVGVLQALLSTATVALAFSIGRRMSAGAAFFAAAGTALHVTLIYYAGFLLSETVFAFLLALTVWLLMVAAERWSLLVAACAGLVLGLAATVRPNGLLLAPLLPFWAFAASGRRLRRAAALTAAIALGALAPVLSASAHNTGVAGHLTGLGTNGGLNFFLNLASVKGVQFKEGALTHHIFPIPNMLRFAQVLTTDVPLYDDAHWWGEGWKLLSPATLSRNLENLVEGAGIGMQSTWPGSRGWGDVVLRVFNILLFVVVLAPALVGLLAGPHDPQRLLLGLVLASAALTLWLLLGDPRMRVPYDPLAMPLAWDGWLAIAVLARRLRPRKAAEIPA